VQTLGGFLIDGAALFELLVEAGEFSAQIGAFVRRGLGRDKRAGSERRVAERAVEPEPELPFVDLI
jgi:hypothetical protein